VWWRAALWLLVLLAVVGIPVVLFGLLRPHAFAALVWKLSRSEEKTTAAAPGGTDAEADDAVLPFYLATARVDRALGFSPDGEAYYLQAQAASFLGKGDGTTCHWLWEVNLTNGQIMLKNSGEVIAATIRDGCPLFLQQTVSCGNSSGWPGWLPPILELARLDEAGERQVLTHGDIDHQWFGFSLEGERVFFNRRGDSGLAAVLLDLGTGAEERWIPRETDENETSVGRKGEGYVVSWLEGGDRLLRMRRSPLELRRDGHAWTASRFEVGSVETGEILDSLDLSGDRVLIHGPVYNEANHFFLVTRNAGSRDSPRSLQVDFFEVSPLRAVASCRGVIARWAPNHEFAVVEEAQGRREYESLRLRVFRTTTGEVEEVPLQSLVPPMDRWLPSSISPDSRFVLLDSFTGFRLGILDLDSLDLVRVVEGISVTQGVWSPDSTRVSLRGYLPGGTDPRVLLLDAETGAVRSFVVGDVRPIPWADDRTALFINRWVGNDPLVAVPMALTAVDALTGAVREIPLH